MLNSVIKVPIPRGEKKPKTLSEKGFIDYLGNQALKWWLDENKIVYSQESGNDFIMWGKKWETVTTLDNQNNLLIPANTKLPDRPDFYIAIKIIGKAQGFSTAELWGYIPTSLVFRKHNLNPGLGAYFYSYANLLVLWRLVEYQKRATLLKGKL